MKYNKFSIRNLSIFLGFLAVTLFIFNFWILSRLRPKMVGFEGLSTFEEGLLTAVGIGLVLIFFFYFLSLLQLVRYIRHAEQIKPFPLSLIISGVLSLLFLFTNFALLSDIHKQYQHGLSQPEWLMVLPIMSFQLITTIALLYFHIANRFNSEQTDHAARDINIFLIVQYVGVISGLMGLGLAGLGFIFPGGWNTTTHTIMGGLVLLFPYILVIFYWFVTKWQENERQLFDEKQSIDVGKSALLTLTSNTFLMLILFIININNLDGIIHRLWLPIYLFAVIFSFSLGNLFFSRKY